MFTNLDNIDKTIKILSKSLSKKYPYLSDIQVKKIGDETGLIYIDLDLDLNRLLEDNKLKIRPDAEYIIKSYLDDIEYVKDVFELKTSYLNTFIGDYDPLDNTFGYKKNEEIENYLSNMMSMLPPPLVPIYKHQGSFGTYEYPVDFRIMGYNTKFDPIRYLDYIGQNKSDDNIFESKIEKRKKLIVSMVEKDHMTFEDIMELTGLSMEQIITSILDYEIGIGCGLAHELILIMLSETDLIKTYFKIGGVTLSIESDPMNHVNVLYNNRRYMIEGQATPYWDKECWIPLDINHFLIIESGDYDDDYHDLGLSNHQIPKRFNTINDLIKFMNTQYPRIVIEMMEKSIPLYLRSMHDVY